MKIELSLGQAQVLQLGLERWAHSLDAEFTRQNAAGYVSGSLMSKIADCEDGLAKAKKAIQQMRYDLQMRGR